MSYNGSGTFVVNSAGQPVVTGTVISSTAFNALTADLATGLSTAITKDGQTTTTVRVPFAAGISSTLTTDATSSTTGSIITAGGISCQKALYVGTTATATSFNGSTLANHTRQVFLSGTAATYTTPANVRQLVIRIKGGGGGGSGTGTGGASGGAGGTTIFNSINANGGAAGVITGASAGGAGGTGGTGTASVRISGHPGNGSALQIWTSTNFVTSGGNGGGNGGGVTTLPGSTTAGVAGVANTGGGGSGATNANNTQVTLSGYTFGAGGGEGEYAEIIINSPSATYTYTVGAGGTAGAAGTSGAAGGAGGTGIIIVDEYY